jgi:plasmid stabilization system protein ParE
VYQYLLEPKAQKEYEESIEFYAERSEKATLNFIYLVEQAINLICKNPYGSKNKYKNFFEITLEKYPFTIIYSIEQELNLLVIISIYHHSRNPKYKYKAKKLK